MQHIHPWVGVARGEGGLGGECHKESPTLFLIRLCCFEIKVQRENRAISQVKVSLPKLCLTFLTGLRRTYRSAGQPTRSVAAAAARPPVLILFVLDAPEKLFCCHFGAKSSRVHFSVSSPESSGCLFAATSEPSQCSGFKQLSQSVSLGFFFVFLLV